MRCGCRAAVDRARARIGVARPIALLLLSFIYARLQRTGGRLLGFIERIISRLASVFHRCFLNELKCVSSKEEANGGRVLRNRFALFARSTIIYSILQRKLIDCKSDIAEARKSVLGEKRSAGKEDISPL